MPTDERFINLYEEQKIALFEGINNLPGSEDIKRVVMIQSKIDDLKQKKDDEILSVGLRNNLFKMYKEQGIEPDKIEKLIKSQVEKKRKIEIAELESQLK